MDLPMRTPFNHVTSLCTGLYGRVVKANSSARTPLRRLSSNPDRVRLSFVMGDDGLGLMMGKSGYERLLAIGWTMEHIREVLLAGHVTFKLLLFAASEREARHVGGTWWRCARSCTRPYKISYIGSWRG